MSHPFAEATSAVFESVGRVEDWKDGEVKHVMVHKKPMAIVRRGEAFFALNAVCPHLAGPLACGTVEGEILRCPWHGWGFDIKTGQSPNGHTIACYEVSVENGDVRVGWVKRETV